MNKKAKQVADKLLIPLPINIAAEYLGCSNLGLIGGSAFMSGRRGQFNYPPQSVADVVAAIRFCKNMDDGLEEAIKAEGQYFAEELRKKVSYFHKKFEEMGFKVQNCYEK